jgi:hypothetical protein
VIPAIQFLYSAPSRCFQQARQDQAGFGQYSIGFRRKSFCDGSRIVAEQDSWCHVDN